MEKLKPFTLQECKEIVAKRNGGYNNWDSLVKSNVSTFLALCLNEAAEMYAKQAVVELADGHIKDEWNKRYGTELPEEIHEGNGFVLGAEWYREEMRKRFKLV